MAKDKITSCKYYVAFGICAKGRDANHKISLKNNKLSLIIYEVEGR